MSEERFTQGKWYADGVFVTNREDKEIVSGVFYASTEELEANAKLISAAPDMYRALQALNSPNGLEGWKEAAEMGIKALAKARGEL